MKKRKRLILVCLALLVAAAVWLFISSSSRQIPVTLLGYTNDVTGILAASYEATNIAHSGFAMFRVQNPTGRDFLCYIGPVIVGTRSNRMQHAQAGDFSLAAGASVIFAVPVPEVRGPWQCGLYLFPERHYSRLHYAVVRFRERCGLGGFEKPWFATSPEIVR
ncbi:MAG: hypothetical protein QOF48_228 [Verrucomicrobiota bacterium]|jgi:hypothetical protein